MKTIKNNPKDTKSNAKGSPNKKYENIFHKIKPINNPKSIKQKLKLILDKKDFNLFVVSAKSAPFSITSSSFSFSYSMKLI